MLRDQFPFDELVELVQVDVTEQGRYHAALRGAAERVVVLPVFHVPGLEHVTDQPEKPVIVDFLCQDPQEDLMVGAAEAVRDITLDEPHGTGPSLLHFPQCGVTASPFPEAVGTVRKLRLVIRFQQEPNYFADKLV